MKYINKKTIIIGIIVLLIILLGIGGYLYWTKKSKAIQNALDKTGGAAEKITESASKGVLPSIQTNPLDEKPDINPADKANPYTDVKTNPFE